MSKKIDPRVIRTREMIENSLIELMEEKDFGKITVQEITERSTLNRGTFYLHYFDKEDLLVKLLDSALRDLKESVIVKDVEFKYVSNTAHPIFVRLFEKMLERPKFYKVILAQRKVPYFIEAVADIIKDFVEAGTDYMLQDGIELQVPVEISNTYIAEAYLGVIIWWLKNDMPYTPNYMAIQLTKLSTVGPFKENPYLIID